MIKKFFSIREEPWISKKARKWLISFLRPEMIVFEYGSGGSTLFLARRVKRIISVEYQFFWFFGVLLALLRRGMVNFWLHYSGPERTGYLVKNYMSSDLNISSLSFKKFVTTIDQYPNHYFDLVFVDGRARNQCIKHAISKVKQGGYILLDDSNRNIYLPGKKYLSKYKQTKLDNASVWKINIK